MKYLITLLILVSINCQAQSDILKIMDDKIVTLSDMLDYTAYCYNDSTKVCEKGTYVDYLMGGSPTLVECFEWKWVHSTPTFEGFIKYLLKKYGK